MGHFSITRTGTRFALSAALLVGLPHAVPARAGDGHFEHRWDPAVGQPGTNGPIRVLHAFDDGSGESLYAGGDFNEAGGLVVNNLARWDGEQWHDVGGGVWGEPDTPPPFGGFVPVRAMAVHDDGSGAALYVAGDFTHAGPQDAPVEVNRIARWDGTSWSAVGGGFAAGTIKAVASFQGELYTGGDTLAAGDLSREYPGIARWDGESWSALPGGFAGTVNAFLPAPNGLASDPAGGSGPTLYVAGNIDSAGGQPMTSVARWNGSEWSAIGTPTSGSGFGVLSIALFDSGDGDRLHSGSDIYVYEWIGDEWVQLPNCSIWGGPEGAPIAHINSISSVTDESGESLYVAGHLAGGCGSSHSVTRWQGGQGHGMHFGAVRWELPYSQLWGQAWAVAGFDDDGDGVETVYVAGDFHYAGEFQSMHIAAAYPVAAPGETCDVVDVQTIQEPQPESDAGFGCEVAVHENSAVIRRCSLIPGAEPPGLPHAVYFFERIDGQWQAQTVVEDMALGFMGDVIIWGNAAAVRAGDELWIFERPAGSSEWSHVQTLDAGNSMAMQGPWLMIDGGSEIHVYERDDESGQWTQTGAIDPPSEGAHIWDMHEDRMLISEFVYEYDGEWSLQGSAPTSGPAQISGDVIATFVNVDTPELKGIALYVRQGEDWVHTDTVIPLFEYLDYMPWFCEIEMAGDMLVAHACGDWDDWVVPQTFIFKRFGDRWFYYDKFQTPTDGGTLALDGQTLMIGAMDAWPWGQAWEGAVFTYDLSDCLPPEPGLLGDLNEDGAVNEQDLLLLLESWGSCESCEQAPCPADVDGDCNVGVSDLLALLANWG